MSMKLVVKDIFWYFVYRIRRNSEQAGSSSQQQGQTLGGKNHFDIHLLDKIRMKNISTVLNDRRSTDQIR